MPSPRSLIVLFALSLSGPALAQSLNPTPTRTNPSRSWMGFANSPQHNGLSRSSGQPLNQIHWSAPVDQNPQYSGSALLIHYGSPLSTKRGMIVFPVKTGATGGFQVQGRKSTDGTLVWTTSTDYIWPPHNWGPSVGCTLTPQNKVAIPAAGGTILLRSDADAAVATAPRLAFYGLASYNANQATYNANVVITTPITSDDLGNLYFGFLVQGATPTGLSSGIARIAANGTGSWVSAATAAADGSIQKVTYNCAPALSHDGASLYVEVNDSPGSGFGFGYLLRLNSTTLAMQSRVRLTDANSGFDAYLPDDGTASPMVGPEGDVYIGVLEDPFPDNNDRGWMLHFDATLSTPGLPGAFGWDNTPSVVPRNAVPSYAGPSSYLLLTKYNNYAGVGSGDGVNKIAVLDPNTSMIDPVTGATVMDEVLTIAGVTPDLGAIGSFPNAVREWCINTAVVDPLRRSALVNSEDGALYRWDFVTNTFSESIQLTAGIGEAYTPTMIAPDGTVFAINNATLFAVGR
jgi:hypothetical protein